MGTTVDGEKNNLMGGTRHVVFILAAMILLSQISLVVNQYIGGSLVSSLSAEATITATGLAQSMILEVGTKAFDAETVAGEITVEDSLTGVGYLGPEGGEAYPNYDDIDDFHGYERIAGTPRLGDFRVRTQVWYIDPADPENPAGSQTFYKRMTVTVDQNPTLEYTISVTKVVSY